MSLKTRDLIYSVNRIVPTNNDILIDLSYNIRGDYNEESLVTKCICVLVYSLESVNG